MFNLELLEVSLTFSNCCWVRVMGTVVKTSFKVDGDFHRRKKKQTLGDQQQHIQMGINSGIVVILNT